MSAVFFMQYTNKLQLILFLETIIIMIDTLK